MGLHVSMPSCTSEVQSPGCSSPTPFLRAGFEARNLGGRGHMSRLASARCKSSGSLRLRVCPLKHVPLPLPLGPPLQPSYPPHGFLTSTAPLTIHLSPPFSQLALTVKEQTKSFTLGCPALIISQLRQLGLDWETQNHHTGEGHP